MATWSCSETGGLFRVLLLRRLWLPIPPSDRNCRCGLPHNPRGPPSRLRDGGLGRGFALESAATRACWDRADALDKRRLEIVADGLPFFLGAQLAVDTTLASVLRRDGSPRPRCANEGRRSVSGSPQAQRRDLPGAHGSQRADQAGCVGLRGWGMVVRGAQGPGSSSLAVEVGNLAGVQCCKGLRTFSA